jgi:putative nucleotidyltransferase with HDIG domain
MVRANLKKISVDDLKVGMFIVNLGRSWIRHPFFRNQLKISSEKQINKLKNHDISDVYIDPARGLDVSPRKSDWDVTPGLLDKIIEPQVEVLRGNAGKPLLLSPHGSPTLPATPFEENPGNHEGAPDLPPEQRENSDSMVYWQENVGKVEESLPDQDIPPGIPFGDHVPYAKELETAQVAHKEAQNVVRNIMNDVRMGKSIESERVKKVVNSMVDSILRNPDAMVSLTQMKNYDEYTFVHSLDVCILSLSMARHINLSREEMMQVGIGALLHDVGKMKIDPYILKKPDTLSAQEWVEMRKHPIYSLQIMEASHGFPEESKQLALQHHERYNGTGYPFGLKGEGIGVLGQIVGIVDFYDAITSDRAFRKALQPHEAIRQIYEKGHVEFDRLLVERFIQCIGIYPFGTLVLLDTEEMAVVCGTQGDSLLRPQVLVIYRNSKTPYPEPFLADLSEKSESSSWYRRSIIMPLDPEKWNIQLETYLGDLRKNLNGQIPAF